MPRLLLVDDNPSIQKIVVSLLAPAAMEVSYATSAIEAFGLITKEAPYDVALIDTTLPEMDGWELMKRLRANPKTADMPIGMMAGILEDVDPGLVENAPIQVFLRKPVDLRNLVDKVNALLPNPIVPNVTTVPLKEPLPSDLLLLEEQDLAEDIAFTPEGEVTATIMALSPGIDSAQSNNANDSEELISLELEELDFNAMDELAPDVPEFTAQPDISPTVPKASAQGSDLLDVLESNSQQTTAPDEDQDSPDDNIEPDAPSAASPPQGSDLLDVFESNSQQTTAPDEDQDSPDDNIKDNIKPDAPPAASPPQSRGLLNALGFDSQQAPPPDEDRDSLYDPDGFPDTIEPDAPPVAPSAQDSDLSETPDDISQQTPTPSESSLPTKGDDLGEAPNIISTNLSDTSPEDFGPEILLNENLDGLSTIGSELLSNTKFINAVAKAVAKNLDRQGHKF